MRLKPYVVRQEGAITRKSMGRTSGKLGARRKAAAWDTLAAFMLFAAPFANFLAVRDYGFVHVEVFAAFSFLLLLAAGVALIVALRPDSLRPIVFTLLVIMVFYGEIEMPRALASRLSPVMEEALKFLALFLPVATVMWCLRAHIGKIVATAFGVMVLSSVVLPRPPVERITLLEQDQAPTTERGPIVHLILDQQIGINGLVDEIPGAEAMRGELSRLYQGAGFRVYTNAFTHFPATLESLPNLMNNSVEPNAHRWIEYKAGRGKLSRNQWFRYLRAQGYAIDVLQSGYVDFCADPAAPVTRCETYNRKDIRILHDLDSGPLEKAHYLLLYSFEVDYVKLSRGVHLAWHIARRLGARVGPDLPRLNVQGLSPSSVVSLSLMDRVAERLETIGPGEAYVAHLLLPHHPYVLEENCQVKPHLGDWTARKEPLWWVPVVSDPAQLELRHQEYFKQMRCLNRRLAALFDILERRGVARDATVIVHGDHGSLISRLEPLSGFEAALSPLDIISGYSTLFAVKAPGSTAGLDPEFASIQGLFARHVMGLEDFVDHGDIFLLPNGGVIGPGQRRRPMVDLEPIENGRRLQTSER